MGLWDRVKKDIQKGVDESIAAVRKGATVAVEKAEELAEEGKRRYKVFELKMKVQSNFTELGGKVYDLASKSAKSPLLDAKVKSLVAGVKKLEAQIAKLEKTAGASAKKGKKKSKRK
jgi:hypothetical protein